MKKTIYLLGCIATIYCGINMQAIPVCIQPNSEGTIGLNETKSYKEEKEIILGQGTKCIGTGAFRNFENLVSITYTETNSVKIGTAAFAGCHHLTTVSIPKTGEVGIQAFKDCTSLQEIDLSYTTILNKRVFLNCTALRKVYLYENCSIDLSAFENCPNVQIERVNSLE